MMKFYKCDICGKIIALVPYEKVKNVYEYCTLHGLWKS